MQHARNRAVVDGLIRVHRLGVILLDNVISLRELAQALTDIGVAVVSCRSVLWDANGRKCAGALTQLANLLRNSCSSSRYLKALRPSMKTTGTSSVNWRRRPSSVSTSTSCQWKPPRRSSLVSFSFTISQRWHPLREYTMTSRSSDMPASLAKWPLLFQKNLPEGGL